MIDPSRRNRWVLLSAAAAHAGLGVACGPAADLPAEATAVTSEALVDGARLPLRPWKITNEGVVPLGEMGTPTTGRDGTECVKLGDRSLFVFGDTLAQTPSDPEPRFYATNSMLWTTDTNFADGISTDPSVTQNLRNSEGVPIEFVPRDGNDVVNQDLVEEDERVAIFIWPGQFFKNPVDGKTYFTHSKFAFKEGLFTGVGIGVAEVHGHTVPTTRLVLRPDAPVHSVTEVAETRMLFAADMPGWGHLAIDPEAGDLEVVNVDGEEYLYLYDAVYADDGTAGHVFLFRALLRDGNSDGTPDFRQWDQWRAWSGKDTAGDDVWDLAADKQPLITSSVPDAVANHMSVKWNPYHRAYLMTYFETGPGPLPSLRLMMRTAATPTGPWSAPTHVYTSEENAFPYVGRTLACVAEASGRTEYLSYSLQGSFTGSGIMLKQMRFAGARGDIAGNARTDITILGGAGATDIPIATADADGTFSPIIGDTTWFPEIAALPNVMPVAGDFDGDGRGDLAVAGGGLAGAVFARSLGDGSFEVSAKTAGSFGSLASSSGARIVAGDFDGNGRDDMALVGGSSNGTPWTTIPVASSSADGTLSFTNASQPDFTSQAVIAGVTPIPGDFDGDGDGDIALTGGAGWSGIVIAYATGSGNFTTAPRPAPWFAAFAALGDAKPVSGDFNGDGVTDLALVWPPIASQVGLALVSPGGTVTEVAGLLRTGANLTTPDTAFTAYAQQAGARAVAGDFNGDGIGDIALVGVPASTTMPVALGTSILEGGNIKFRVVNQSISASFVNAASTTGAKALAVY
jgi:hypothetical protein